MRIFVLFIHHSVYYGFNGESLLWELWEKCIPFKFVVYLCNVHRIHVRQESLVYLSTTEDIGRIKSTCCFCSRLRAMENLNPFRRIKAFIAGNNPVLTIWQQERQTFKGLTSHNDDMTCSFLFKEFQIIRQVPNQGIIFTDHTIMCYGYD